MSTKSVSRLFSRPNAALEKTSAWRTDDPASSGDSRVAKNLSPPRLVGVGFDLGQALQHQPRGIFGNIEAELHVRALDLHFRRLGEEEQLGVRQFEQALGFIPDPRGQLAGGLAAIWLCRISRAFTGFWRVSESPKSSQLSRSSLLKTGENTRPSFAGSRETRRSALPSFKDWKRSKSGPVILRSGSIPSRTRASEATSFSPPIARVRGPTRARAIFGSQPHRQPADRAPLERLVAFDRVHHPRNIRPRLHQDIFVRRPGIARGQGARHSHRVARQV